MVLLHQLKAITVGIAVLMCSAGSTGKNLIKRWKCPQKLILEVKAWNFDVLCFFFSITPVLHLHRWYLILLSECYSSRMLSKYMSTRMKWRCLSERNIRIHKLLWSGADIFIPLLVILIYISCCVVLFYFQGLKVDKEQIRHFSLFCTFCTVH